ALPGRGRAVVAARVFDKGAPRLAVRNAFCDHPAGCEHRGELMATSLELRLEVVPGFGKGEAAENLELGSTRDARCQGERGCRQRTHDTRQDRFHDALSGLSTDLPSIDAEAGRQQSRASRVETDLSDPLRRM